jgi:hypothetical protein
MKKVLFAIITSHFVKLSVILLSFVFHSLSSIAQVPSYAPTSGLVGWWPFNGNANDESGNGNNGTVNGATLTTDRFGVANKAYNFDGNDFIQCGQTPAMNNSTNWSIFSWVKVSSLNSWLNCSDGCGMHFVSRDRDITSSHYSLSATQNQSNGTINLYSIDGNLSSNSNISVPMTNWMHFGIRKTNTSVELIVNGTVVSSALDNSSIASSTGNLFFGKHLGDGFGNYLYYMKGSLDDIAIYNRALTQQEITNLYNSSVPPTLTLSSSQGFINCEQSSILTASSSSSAQPCSKVDLPATLQNGLVGYWPFCGNANDASGNNNNGTVNGATLTTDRFGNAGSAYSFDGVNDYGTLGITLPNVFSVSCWFNINTFSTYVTAGNNLIGSEVLSTYNNNFPSTGFAIGLNGTPASYGSHGTSFWCNSGCNNVISSSNVSLNQWVFVTTTYNGSSLKYYVNGILDGTTQSNFVNNSVIATIGARIFHSNGPDFFLNGKIDDIAIYNRALTASEIQQLFNLGNVTYSWSTGATTPSISVSPTQTTSYTCTATNSAGSTTSSVTVTVADTLTWTGAIDTDWHKACNWNPEFVPKCCNSVKIPLTTNQPIIAGVAASKDITIQTTSGALLTVNNGANLQIQDCPIVSTTNTCPVLALLTTTAASSITQTTAVSGGTITYQGSSAITARGVCWSTSPNPTLSNSFTTNGTGNGTFTSNLVGLTGGTTYYVRAYATNGSGTSYGNQLSFVSITPQPTYPIGSVFCTGSPTLVIDVTNPTTGKTWMDRNLGATQVATSSTDAAAYGDLYQWGRRSDGHHCRNSATTTTLSSSDQPAHGNFILAPNSPYDWRNPQNTNLWQGANGVNNPCPSGYRLPTDTELNSERLSWSNNNSSGAFTSPLKLPAAGRRLGSTGSIGNVGLAGYYWSNVVFLNAWGGSSRRLYFMSSNGEVVGELRNYGFSVRCIKN